MLRRKAEKRIVELSPDEARLLREALLAFRNKLLSAGKPTEDVNELIIKVMKRGEQLANFYISDLHIGHENILRFDNRPFADVNEMNNKLIENWNARVRSDDTVYSLGDFIWAKESEWPSIVGLLGGNKVLRRGYHDP